MFDGRSSDLTNYVVKIVPGVDRILKIQVNFELILAVGQVK